MQTYLSMFFNSAEGFELLTNRSVLTFKIPKCTIIRMPSCKISKFDRKICILGSTETTRLLLEAGANVSAINRVKRTASQLGAFIGKAN